SDLHTAACLGRREFLRAGALGLYGLTLPQLLARHAHAAAQPVTGGTRRGRARACIVLFMWGGPAQQDTWDMKPLAPVEYRGEFHPITPRVPGMQMCELLPLLAQRSDQLALLRAMTHNDVNHLTAPH